MQLVKMIVFVFCICLGTDWKDRMQINTYALTILLLFLQGWKSSMDEKKKSFGLITHGMSFCEWRNWGGSGGNNDARGDKLSSFCKAGGIYSVLIWAGNTAFCYQLIYPWSCPSVCVHIDIMANSSEKIVFHNGNVMHFSANHHLMNEVARMGWSAHRALIMANTT